MENKIVEILKDNAVKRGLKHDQEYSLDEEDLNEAAKEIAHLYSAGEEVKTITEILWVECNKKSDLLDKAIFNDGVSVETINHIFAEASIMIKSKLTRPTVSEKGVFPTWEDAMSGITDHRITKDDFQHMVSSGARIMYDRLYSMLNHKLTRPTVSEEEKWKRPTDKQVIDICILFNDGKLEAEKLVDMVAPIDFILDRLFEKGDVAIPSSKELNR